MTASQPFMPSSRPIFSTTSPATVSMPGGAKPAFPPGIETVAGDVVENIGLDEGMKGCDAVIHLVGMSAEPRGAPFERVHHLGTRNVVEAAKRSGIGRFIQMSALGARDDGVAEYQVSKWKGEEAVRQSGIPFCILRPSLIFGPGDGFVTQMLDVMRKAVLVRPVPGNGRPKFRPILIDDVAGCFSKALTTPAATGNTIDLGGGEELTLNEVLAEIAAWAGIRKPALHVPMPIMMTVAAVAANVAANPPGTTRPLYIPRDASPRDS